MNRVEALEEVGADAAGKFQITDVETFHKKGELTHTAEQAAEQYGRVIRRRELYLEDHVQVAYTLETTEGNILYRTEHPQHLLSEPAVEATVRFSYWSADRDSFIGSTMINPAQNKVIEKYREDDNLREVIINFRESEVSDISSR